jgi:hypothetical protein
MQAFTLTIDSGFNLSKHGYKKAICVDIIRIDSSNRILINKKKYINMIS